jgi:DNA-binding transcriptional LysR family regulator
VETGRAAVEAVAGLAAGRLDLVALPTLAVDPVAPLVGAFRVAHPGVDIALADPADAAAVVDLVASGESELGITAEPVLDTGLTSHPLGRQDLLAVLPPGSNASPTMAVSSLARFPLVTAPPGTTTRTQLEDAFNEARVIPRIAVVTAQREAILPLVLAGAGATLFPRPLAEQAAALGATVVALRPRLTRPVHLFHRTGPLSPAAAAFRELALR